MTEAPARNDHRNPRVAIGVTAVAALFVATRFVAFRQVGESVYGRVPLLDARDYHNLAVRMATGGWQQPEAFFYSPGWPVLLALWYKLTEPTLAMARLLNVLLSAATIALAMRIGWRIGRAPVGIGAGMLLTCCGSLALHEQTALVEVSSAFTITVALYLLVEFLQREPADAATAQLPWPALLAGLAVGACLPFRSTAAVLALPFAVALWRSYPDVRARSLAGALFLLGATIPVAPFALHNGRAERALIPISSNFGVNLYIGNNPLATGAYTMPAALDNDPRGASAARRALKDETADSKRISAHWSAEARRFLAGNPTAAIRLLAQKALLLLSLLDFPQIYDERELRAVAPILRALPVSTGTLPPLAFAAAVLAWQRRQRGLLLLALAAALLLASLLPFFVVGRFRLPVLPALAVLAAWWIVELLRCLRDAAGDRRSFAPSFAALALATLAGQPLWLRFVPAFAHWDEGTRLHAIENRAALLVEDGNLAEAEATLREIPEARRSADTWSNIGKCIEARAAADPGLWAEAARHYREGLLRAPDNPFLWYNLAQATLRAGDRRGAIEAYRNAYARMPQLPESGRFNLALLLRDTGDAAGAREQLEELRRRHPQSPLIGRLEAILPHEARVSPP